MCAKLDPLSHFKILQMEIFSFSQKENGDESVAMAIHLIPKWLPF